MLAEIDETTVSTFSSRYTFTSADLKCTLKFKKVMQDAKNSKLLRMPYTSALDDIRKNAPFGSALRSPKSSGHIS